MGKQSHFGHLLAKDCLESWLHQVGIVHGKSAWLYCLKSVAVAVCVSEGDTPSSWAELPGVKTTGEGFLFQCWSWKMKHPLRRSQEGLERKVGKQTSLSSSLILAFLTWLSGVEEGTDPSNPFQSLTSAC